jgi:serine/threonine protein kinase
MMSENDTLTPAAFVPLAPTELNGKFGPHLEVLDLIGQGGMGAVYKARQIRLNRIVALKVLPPLEKRDGWDFHERFQMEARAMAKLDHPGIVTIHDFGETEDNMLYFMMEYVDGEDLHRLIHDGQLSVEHVLSWIPQLADALEYAHQKGLVHRDVKPANLMITYEGHVKITDFGLVKMRPGRGRAGLTEASLSVGTPCYLAPEAFESGADVDSRADVYSLGVVLYEMLTGMVPRGAWLPPSQCRIGIDPRFDAIVYRALQTNRDARYPRIADLGAEVMAIAAEPQAKPRRKPVATAKTEPVALTATLVPQPTPPPMKAVVVRAVDPDPKKV